jgi:uncharacterized protein YhhL (DUF1145 family)
MQGLQLGLLLDGSHQGMTISVEKELRDKPPDPILGFDCIAHALLLLQRVLKIFSHGDRIAILILKPKRKVSQDPKEAWKVLSHLICIFGLLALLDLQGLRKIDHQREVVERILIYWSHAVVYEERAEQQREQEDLRIVILLLVESSKAFCIDNDDRHLLLFISLTIENLSPKPKSLRASIDSWPNLKSTSSIFHHLLLLSL